MPSNYTGNGAGIALADPVTISNPDDLENATAASNAAAPKTLADWVDFVRDNAAFNGQNANHPAIAYTTPLTRFAYCSPGEMSWSPDANAARTMAQAPYIEHTDGTLAFTVFARFMVPRGATLTGIQWRIKNLSATNTLLCDQLDVYLKHYLVTAGGIGEGWTDLLAIQNGAFTTVANTADWYARTAGGTWTNQVVGDGHIIAYLQIRNFASSGDHARVYGARLAYTMPNAESPQ